MIRINEIQSALLHLVGWQQSYDPEQHISEELTQSESGLYFQQAHPMVTLDNIRAIMPEYNLFNYPAWNQDAEYSKGAKVIDDGVVYKSLVDHNTGIKPSTSDADWQLYDFASEYIEGLTKQTIAKVVQQFLTQKSLLRESKTLLERRSLFDGAGRMNNTCINGQRLVGMEIVPAYSMGVTTKLERIGLQMTGATGKVLLYVFHSSQREPYMTIEFDVVKGNGSMEWKTLNDVYLPYMGDTGAWYVVYNQSDLPAGMEAINVTKDWSREPCGTCNRGSLEAWRALTKYLMVSPFRVAALETFAEYPELWDIEDNIYTNTQNYGINMELSIGCDLTDFVISQRAIFANVLQKQMAADVLRALAMNPDVRVNRNQANASREDLLYEVDGNPQGRATGIGKELKDAYDALDLDTRGIDRICLTCKPTRVRYTHV
jgi:hypothetical protein